MFFCFDHVKFAAPHDNDLRSYYFNHREHSMLQTRIGETRVCCGLNDAPNERNKEERFPSLMPTSRIVVISCAISIRQAASSNVTEPALRGCESLQQWR